MSAQPIDLNAYRKRQSKRRIIEAIEQIQTDILDLEQRDSALSADELEECLAHILGDHLVGALQPAEQAPQAEKQTLESRYRNFQKRLKKWVKIKASTMRYFEDLKPLGKKPRS